jgi:hypothetical protein
MHCAYDNSKPGFQVKVQATGISGSHNGQYLCTLCGEPVRFYRGVVQKSHFRHERGSIISQTCEFYSGNISEFSEDDLKRKISGLPFYLKQIGDSFQLYLGFWPVDESILTEEKRIGQKITIKSEKKLQVDVINLANVRAKETYRLPISWVYDSYEINYAKSRTALPEIWGDKTSRIFSKGTFFRIGDIYSRSISLNGVITTNTCYYFLFQGPFTNKSFLEVEESYSLLTNETQKWKVYKIRFTKITEESAKYARDRHVQLLEKPPELIPLWPPSIQNNRKYIHKKTGLSTYRLSSSNKYGKWEVAILNNYEKPTDKLEVSLKDPVFSIEVDNNIQYLSFFDTDNDLVGVVARSDKKAIPYQQPTVELKWMKKQILPGSELNAIKNADLSIKSDMKCDIIRIRNHIPNLIFRDKLLLLSFPDLSSDDTIIIKHGLDTLAPLHIRKYKKTVDDKYSNNLSDEALYQKLLQLKGTSIATPTQLKYIAAGLGNYSKTREYLKKSFKTGRVSKQAAEYLLKIYGKENSK